MVPLYIAILVITGGSAYLLSESLLQIRPRPRLRGMPQARRRAVKLSSIKALQPLVRATRPIAELPYLRMLQAQTEILRINMDLPGLVLVKVFLAAIAGVVTMLLFSAPVNALIALSAGFFIPDFLFFNKIKAKKEIIVRVFPETVDLMDLCIGAGLDFTSSMKWIIEKSDANPFVEQLGIVLSEIQVGRSRAVALKDMAKRLNLPDISSFVRTVIQSERMGTSVEEAFRNLSEDTRNMRYQNGERYAIKASLKILFPLLFFILPVILIVVAGPIMIKFTQGDLIPTSF